MFVSSLKPSIFNEEELKLLDRDRIPHHVAIIGDGNRSWAQKRKLPFILGHWRGAERMRQIVKASSELKIKVITVFGFSTENWSRPTDEIESLMRLYRTYLIQEREEMLKEGVRLNSIGDYSHFPSYVIDALEETKMITAQGEKIELIFALGYGGRDDIRRATVRIVEDVLEGKVKKEEVSEKLISSYLDTSRWPDPDLLIRTSGEFRLSNFLLWQLSYAEVYTTNILWPDFTEKDLLQAIISFQQRLRRYGE